MNYPASGVGGGPAAVAGPARICHAVTLGLSAVIFFLGFATISDNGSSYFESGIGFVVPAFFLLGGLFAVPGLLPASVGKAGFFPVAGTAPAALGQLFSTFAFDGDKGTGFILILIFGLFQLVSAVAGFLLETGIVKLPANRGPYPGQPSGQWQQGGYPQQPYPQQPGYGGYGQQYPGQPHPGGYGGQPSGGYPQGGWDAGPPRQNP